ncbi:ABC transporter permease [Accumulibacter sp.]|uniref:ABC transporter permease n=1 Tax=Accumulibacter sp. TaxID=2053492 RepID=UPI0025FB6F49|nr:ABC transporter permease [Accumulibacter sp.]MCM8612194.1 ABC transporter permease [Accumulibacter sp.]MCM8635867.1 ABC transporter permease [Accumulibacter sp.]MCM8639524.1 ABC transporter permease [Accumulibacter sp.]
MPAPEHHARSHLTIALAVWKALFLREAVTRVSGSRAAWLWLILEPVAHLSIVMLIFSAVRRRLFDGVSFALFLAIGILAYNLFRNCATRSMAAISANRALFAYRQVKAVDVVLVRAFLEGVIQFFVGGVLLAAMSVVGFHTLPHDPLAVFFLFAVFWAFGTGVGLILSAGSTLVPEIGKLATLFFVPLYFLSGVLYSPRILPPEMREWLLLNPLMHGLELLRAAFFANYTVVSGVEVGYLVTSTCASIFLGLALHVRFSSRLVME